MKVGVSYLPPLPFSHPKEKGFSLPKRRNPNNSELSRRFAHFSMVRLGIPRGTQHDKSRFPALNPANPRDSTRFPTIFTLSPTTTPTHTGTGPETTNQHHHKTAEFQRSTNPQPTDRHEAGGQVAGLNADTSTSRAESHETGEHRAYNETHDASHCSD